MKHILFIILLDTLSNFVFSQNTLEEKKEYYPNGNIFAIGKVQYNQKQGIWNYYDKKGKLIEKAKFVNGNKYYVNKWEKSKKVVFNGNGFATEYYYNGRIKAKGKVKEGKKHGLWNEYFINGLHKSVLDYKNWASPCRNNITSQCIVKISYDKNKNLICKEGFGYYEYIEDSGKVYQIDFLNNNSKDSVYYFYPNQNLQSIHFINKNQYDIAEILKEFYPNGKISFEVVKSKDTIYNSFYSKEGLLNKKVIKFLDKEINYTYNNKGEIITEQHCTHTQKLDAETGYELVLVSCEEEINYNR